MRDEIGARLDRGRIAIVAIIREQENVGLEAALPLDFVGLRGDVTLLNRVFIRDERRRIEIVWLHLLFAKAIRVLQPLVNRDEIVLADESCRLRQILEPVQTHRGMRHQDDGVLLEKTRHNQCRDSLLNRMQRLDHVGAKIKIDATRREQKLIIGLRSALDDLYLEPVALIRAIDERLVKAAMFGLGTPVGGEAHAIERACRRCGANPEKCDEQRAWIFHGRPSMRRATVHTSRLALAGPESPA